MTWLPRARWITAGLDGVYVMKGAWVSGHSLSGLLNGRQEAPLSSQVPREQAHRHR